MTCKGINKLTGKRCKRRATRGPWCLSHDPKKKAWRHMNAKRAGRASSKAKRHVKRAPEAFGMASDAIQFQSMIDSAVRRSLLKIFGSEA